jgi:alginate O-acetyltransferase complex protein AlgI
LADFWSKRWNLSFSQMMTRAVQRPVAKRFGKRIGVFSVFLVSGLLHELAITLPVQSGYGLPTLYFTAHGLVVLVERDTWPLWRKRILAITLVSAPLPLLFPEQFTQEVIIFTLNQLIIF